MRRSIFSLTPIGVPDATAALGAGACSSNTYAAEGVVRLDLRLSESEIKAGDKLRVFDMNFVDSQIRAGKELWVMVDGAVTHAALMRADGSVSGGKNPIVGGSNATLDIAHGKGLVVAWTIGGDALTSPGVLAKGIELKETASVPLAGIAQRIAFTVTDPKFLRFKTSSRDRRSRGDTKIARLRTAPISIFCCPKAQHPSFCMQRARGAFRSCRGKPDRYCADQRGARPESTTNPGESRLYSFTVKDERDIGVGVRGAADLAHCRVLDAQGKEVGSGVVQMLRLKAGTYLLAVDAPAEGNAIVEVCRLWSVLRHPMAAHPKTSNASISNLLASNPIDRKSFP